MTQRLNKDRYELVGEWYRWSTLEGGIPVPHGIDYWTRDLREKSSGHVFSDGAHRVRIGFPTDGRYKSTTFYGEMAWADAARLISDADSWRRFHG